MAPYSGVAALSLDLVIRLANRPTERLLGTLFQATAHQRTGSTNFRVEAVDAGMVFVVALAVLRSLTGWARQHALLAIFRKILPTLRLGKNTVCVAAGDPSESIVLWQDLPKPSYRTYAVEERNVAQPEQRSFLASLCAEKGGEEAYVVFRIDTPKDVTSVTYGGRYYTAPDSG